MGISVEQKKQKIGQAPSGLEWTILLIFSIYNICMTMMTLIMNWDKWASLMIFMCLVVAWLSKVGNYRDFRFRAIVTVIMMQCTINFYAFFSDNLTLILPAYISFLILAGLYGLMETVHIATLSAVVLLINQMFVFKRIQLESMEEIMRFLLQIGNMFLSCFMVSLWVKKRNESNGHLMKTIEELQEAEQSKDDFLANVSHEIRTPVNSIYGMSEAALKSDDMDKIQEALYEIQSAGRQLMTTISDVLDFSELQSGKITLEEESYNITTTVTDVINMMTAYNHDRKVEIIVDVDANLPSVMLGDEKKLRRVIMNLVSNAMKFTEDGYIGVKIGGRREAYGLNLLITITDTGIGMKEETLEKLCDSFYQADTSRNRQQGGIGLGIAISRAIIRKMGGIITIKSKYGKGSEFKVVVPQKILDENPIVKLNNRKEIKAAIYVDMEQFHMMEIRDGYMELIQHMVEQFRAKYCICRNFAELKRREERQKFTHVLISIAEYMEETEYYEELANRVNLILILNRGDEKYVKNSRIFLVYKPFYVLSIAEALQGEREESYVLQSYVEKFIAPNAHILVVDDNVTNLMVVENLLEEYQIQVTMAGSGEEALKKVEQQCFDFIFMDHMMPGMDGIETLHRIREKVGSYYKNVPILALTANAVAGARDMFLQEGFADFMEKPIELSVLERVLKRNLPKDKIVYLRSQNYLDEQVNIEKKKEEKIPQYQPEMETWQSGDLDIEKGFMYCGGREKYFRILKVHYENAFKNRKQMVELYEQQDWKNYTIAVHALKSSMLSIGAMKLSELARALEKAGKEEDIAYVQGHHEEMLTEYDRVIAILEKCPGINSFSEDMEKEEGELQELGEKDFDEFLIRFEDAAFSLDGKEMLDILSKLEQYQYHGQRFLKETGLIRTKIEMSDYMSASETMQRLRKDWRSRTEGNEPVWQV